MVVGQGMRVVAVGVVLGVAGALALTRFLSSILFEVGATDPRIFLGVSTVMVGVALVGCLLPAWRAAVVNPAMTLRDE
jgi:putative ABC transport system permease protein